MRLICLGTTGYHPSPSRHTACYYLPDQNMVLDAGTGLFRLVQHLLKKPKPELDLLLTHAHLDHTIGLTFLLDAMAVTTLELVRLHGEAEKLDAVKEHLYSELLFPVEPAFEFCPLEAAQGQRQIGSASVEWFPLEHPGGSVGYIISDTGKRLAYVTDTVSRVDADYIELIRGADLLLHECYFGDAQEELAIKTGHSWLSAVTRIVEQSRPKQTLLIHINPLAEVLGTELQLSDTHSNELHIRVAVDELEVVVE